MLRFVLDNAKFLVAGALLTLNSSFGQTFFISIFAAQIMAVYELSSGGWGLVYTISTSVSAIVMFWAGSLTDRFRARQLAWFLMPGLAITCFALAVNQSLAGLLIIVFCLRLFGQGMMFQLATVSMARWFSGRRGLALSISAMGFWIGQAAFPPSVALLLEWLDWRLIWVGSSIFVLTSFPLILVLLSSERSPQSISRTVENTGMLGKHWTRRDVLGSKFFWLLFPLLLGPPAWGTALVFQQVHIANVKGWPLIHYLSLLPVMTTVAIVTTLVSGTLLDRVGSGAMLRIYPIAWALGFLLLGLAQSIFAAGIAFLAFGIATGMQASLITAFWAEYFGTRYIGAIKATSSSIMVFGSAIGPGVTGHLIDQGFGISDQMLAICIYFLCTTLLVWFAVNRANKNLTS